MKQGEKAGLYLSGLPIQVKDCNIAITQPTIKDVVVFGEDDFLVGVNLIAKTSKFLTIKPTGNSQLPMLSDFQLLLVVMSQDEEVEKIIHNFFKLVCPNYIIDYQEAYISFYIQDEKEEDKNYLVGQLNPFTFPSLQTIVDDLFNPTTLDGEPDYDPANDLAAQIAKKLEAGRKRKQKMRAETEGPQSMFAKYVSILSIGLQMDVNIFFNYTPFQIYDAFTRYFDKVSSDLYTKVATTPLMDASAMEEPQEWTRNLYKVK